MSDATSKMGFLLIDKPSGMTSHDVVDALRRLTGIRTIGHAGTLDPFATGLLIVGIGREATKRMAELVGLPKEYEAVFVLGAASDTDDRDGTIVPKPGADVAYLSEDAVRTALQKFTGTFLQAPPAYSARKIHGKKLYELAREGKTAEVEPREVTVSAFDLVGLEETRDGTRRLRVRVACSSGTYIRALARDLGRSLSVGAYVDELRRTKIGPYRIGQAVSLASLDAAGWTSNLSDVNTFLAQSAA